VQDHPQSQELDSVDRLLQQWRQERPELDPSGLAVVLRVTALAGVFAERLKHILAPHGLAPFEYDVLAALRRNEPGPGLSPTALCRTAQLTSGAMTHRLDRLETRGLVERHSTPEDRRGVRVSLTTAGRRLVDSVVGERMADAARSLGRLDAAEAQRLADLLRRLNAEHELPRSD
jgi:DNA-binding MarR family transcriptional regulator